MHDEGGDSGEISQKIFLGKNLVLLHELEGFDQGMSFLLFLLIWL